MQGENVVWIFNRKLECHFPYVQISSAALWFTTSTAYSASHPTTWHLCSYTDNFLTFWMWRLFAGGKMSLSPSHLPSGGFHSSNHPVGQVEAPVSPKQQAQKYGLVPGQSPAHTHTEFWMHFRHKMMPLKHTTQLLSTAKDWISCY